MNIMYFMWTKRKGKNMIKSLEHQVKMEFGTGDIGFQCWCNKRG